VQQEIANCKFNASIGPENLLGAIGMFKKASWWDDQVAALSTAQKPVCS
jgi:hypothetical protein